MGLQRFRADEAGEVRSNGSVPHYTKWAGGPTLALIRHCPIVNVAGASPRTVYITGEPETWFTVPAVCKIKGKGVRGMVRITNDGGFEFIAWTARPATTPETICTTVNHLEGK